MVTQKKAIENIKENISMKNIKPLVLQIVVLALAMGASFYIGMLKTEVKFYKQGLGAANPNNLAAQQGPAVVEPANVEAPNADDHVRGSANARFAIIEYSDYECPFCKVFHETAKNLVEDETNELVWIYRHFPLDAIHPDARPMALASECVYLQAGNDGFWKYTDALMAEEAAIQDLATFIGDLGYNVEEFNTCMDSDEARDLVDADIASASAAGINGTPGNFIYNFETGKSVALFGAVPAENVKQAIDSIRD